MRDRLVGTHAARAKRRQHTFVVGSRELVSGIALPALGKTLKDQPRPEARMTWVPGVISPKEGPLTCATAGMSNGSPLAARFAPTAASCIRAGAKPTGPFQAKEGEGGDQLAPGL